ncbi:uncharacterized protein EV154DRAFT_157613 [Mucor mucedo]|uniref:uncharacterized protein n=1 Tax=Mucor mucedo TaxID=29922 RepID=UPI00221F9D30|nr:uncharacterized protein EV154DRAFT_157613 [Mucor mucedo]KAI7866107.1 hypothetical protein EV154DRAFT_157613 [Mucor mucedo]
MATLERKKKPAIQQTRTEDDDLTDDPVLACLSREPMEYNCLSTQVIVSLESVKHICLQVLDLLLLKLVQDIPRKQHQRRRSISLLDSITTTTNLLQETTMKRSQSSPPPLATTISDVHRILDNHPSDNHGYTLACSLAALLNDVYRLLELNSSHLYQVDTKNNNGELPIMDISLLQQELHEQVTHFQSERAQGNITIEENDASQEMMILWDEMDHLMNIVNGLVLQLPTPLQAAPPPAYPIELPPPAYDSLLEKGHDLDSLLNAIDRLSVVAPQLNNQRVGLTTRQVDALAAATLGKTVERLSTRRMENQRAFLPLKSRHELLQDLMHQVQKSASRSLDNQRVTLSVDQQKRLDMASLDSLLDRLDERRYKNQDFISREEILIKDLTHTTDLLVKSLNRPAYQRQRFSMSALKGGLFQKGPDKHDLNELLDNIYKSKPQYTNQRASFSL